MSKGSGKRSGNVKKNASLGGRIKNTYSGIVNFFKGLGKKLRGGRGRKGKGSSGRGGGKTSKRMASAGNGGR